MNYKTHFFLQKIASKIQVCLILEINIKMSNVWLKIPLSLKNGHIDAAGNLSLSGNIGFSSSRHHKPRTLLNLWCIIALYGASELELKVICVIGNSTIFLLVASFVMEKNKRNSYDAGFKFKVIAYAEEHGNRAAFRPSTNRKNHSRLSG